MKRWLLVAGAVVVVLGLVAGALWVLLPREQRATPPVEVSRVVVPPCDKATPETLATAHPPEPGVVYADVKCAQDRYVLAMMRTTQIESNDVPTLFEFRNDAWQHLWSDTEVPCGDVPKDVWKDLGFRCIGEPVVCREGQQKVIDLGGWVGCEAALDIADRYQAAIKAGQTEGQGAFWFSGDWECAWVYQSGRPHSESPLQCARKSDQSIVQIGD